MSVVRALARSACHNGLKPALRTPIGERRLADRLAYISSMFEHYPEYEQHFARIQLVCFMIVLGTTLSVADFVTVFRRPRSFIAVLLVQFFALPWLAVLIDSVGRLDEGIAVGLVL